MARAAEADHHQTLLRRVLALAQVISVSDVTLAQW